MPDEKSGFEVEFPGTYVLKLILVLKHNLTLRRLTSLQLSEWAPGSIIARMNGSDSE